MNAITVIRLPNPGDAANPLERVITTVARADLDLADALHDGDGIRTYATVRRADTLDVVSFTDELTRALLQGEPAARLVTRVRAADLVSADPPLRVRLAFETPTHFRVAGFDHQLPDSLSLLHSLRARWDALGWEPLSDARPGRMAVWPETLRWRRMPAGGMTLRGFMGVVHLEIRALDPSERVAVWSLLRFGEYRGVGKHTTYGMGRLRVLPEGAPWQPGRRLSVWDGP